MMKIYEQPLNTSVYIYPDNLVKIMKCVYNKAIN